MKAADIPAKFPIPWANSAAPGNINVIPEEPTGTPGQASLELGYPPETMVPTGAGGIPPLGQDTNGILKQTTQWSRWANAGAPVAFDPAFSAAIAGYPQGAEVMSATSFGVWWLSIIDDNTSDPDAGGGGWISFTPVLLYAQDTGTPTAIQITLPVTPASLNYFIGRPICIRKIATANSGNMTVRVNGFANTPLLHADGSNVGELELPASGLLTVVLDPAGNFELLSVASGVRTRLSGAKNFYVNGSTGSDSNNGLTPGTAWQTIQRAWDVIFKCYDLAGFTATVNIADGTYAVGISASGRVVGQKFSYSLVFTSLSGNAAACIVSASATCFDADEGAAFHVSNLKLATTGGACLRAGNRSKVSHAGNIFDVNTSESHLSVYNGGHIIARGNYSITGGAQQHFRAARCGVIESDGVTVTLTGTPNFSAGFAWLDALGCVHASVTNTTFTGAATGPRYTAAGNSVIDTNGGPTTLFPGSTAGTLSSGSQYV